MASTPEKLKNILEKLEELPYRRFAQLMRSKLDDILSEMDAPYLDQYRGRRIPAMISKLYQFGPTTPRRITAGQGGTGFDASATLATPGTYILPRNNNILVGRDRSFYWCRTAVHGYISSTFTSTPGLSTADKGSIINAKPVSDIFSSVFAENGGASVLDNQARDIVGRVENAFSNSDVRPMANWSGELHMYDKNRGRFFSDAPVPMQFYSNGVIGNKALSYNMRFDAGSEIEPRFFLREFRPYQVDSDAAYNALSAEGYLNIVFIGYQELEDGEDEGMFDTLKDPASSFTGED